MTKNLQHKNLQLQVTTHPDTEAQSHLHKHNAYCFTLIKTLHTENELKTGGCTFKMSASTRYENRQFRYSQLHSVVCTSPEDTQCSSVVCSCLATWSVATNVPALLDGWPLSSARCSWHQPTIS